MADVELRRETGASLMFVGLALLVADMLVVFFLPSAIKLGRQAMFLSIMAVLFVSAIILIASGWWKRRVAGAED